MPIWFGTKGYKPILDDIKADMPCIEIKHRGQDRDWLVPSGASRVTMKGERANRSVPVNARWVTARHEIRASAFIRCGAGRDPTEQLVPAEIA